MTAPPVPGENGYSTSAFRIGPSGILGAGLGMFAARNIKKGERIVVEPDVRMPAAHVTAMHPHYRFQIEGGMVQACGPNIARVNHSCSRWNSRYANQTKTDRELHAVASIKKGEEITLCYETQPKLHFTQPDGSKETRATNNTNRARMSMLLKQQFGFLCLCQDCMQDRLCTTCTKRSTELKRCGQCGVAWYCGTLCQRADWKKHKPECRVWSAGKKDLTTKTQHYLY